MNIRWEIYTAKKIGDWSNFNLCKNPKYLAIAGSRTGGNIMLKKCRLITGLVIFSLLIFASQTLAAPTVALDGQQLSFDVPPVIENNRTLVPLRVIFESLGATVEWNDLTQTVTAAKTGTEIKLTLGQAIAYKNCSPVPLDIPAKSIDNRTMVPLRFVSEALGANVRWEDSTQSIYIISAESQLLLSSTQQVRVHFIDVGQADSIYIQLPNHNDILIDGGNVTDGSNIVNYLNAQGVDDIELMIATHPHEDHIGGLPDVLDAFLVEKVIDSGKTYTTNIYKTYLTKVLAESTFYEQDNYQALTWGNTILQILTGNETWDDLNDYSVVCKLDCGNIEFLFDGDAEATAEDDLQGDISAEILKIGHHGSTSSSSASFLSRVMPQVAIISVGAGNTYGHPAAETVTKLQATRAKTYRTDLNGNIVVTTNGNTFAVVTDKNLPVPASPIYTPSPIVSPAPVPIPPAQSTGIYVGSKNSDKYHYPSCSYAKTIYLSNQVWFNNKAEALEAGYEPCGACRP